MLKVKVYNQEGAEVKDLELNEAVFGIEPNNQAIFDMVLLQRASLRQGTHKVKNRTEVSGGGKKPWRQKGTGRARQGSIRAPQWRGGGVVFGPTPQKNYKLKMNRKERRLALKSALSYKYQDNELVIVDNFNLADGKTKTAKEALTNLKVNNEKTMIVVDELTDEIILATRNLDNVLLLETDEVNTLDVVSVNRMVITENAVKKLEEVLG